MFFVVKPWRRILSDVFGISGYIRQIKEIINSNVLITDKIDINAEATLKNGGSVLLLTFGKLMVCSTVLKDKITERAVSKQFIISLLKYMISHSFNPQIEVVFAPGCALMLYKPESAEKLHGLLKEHFGEIDKWLICCKHEPQLPSKTQIINVCPGCDNRFGNDYQNISTISLWEILAESDFFNFPDYKGKRMSILDACPTREKEKVHIAIRTILQKMNIRLEEPKNTRTKSTCCGDSFYGVVPTAKVKELMIRRTSEMPLDDVVVYCISCIKSVYIGGKKPRYLIDLLFDEETLPKTFEPDEWHKELSCYIETH